MTPAGIAGIATGGALLALGVVLLAIPTGGDGTALLVSPRGLALRGTWP